MIVAIILAGGEGSRIGGGKSQRLLRGRTLLQWATSNARAQVDCAALSLRAHEDGGAAADQGLKPLFDDPNIEGPIAGLSAALVWARSEGAEWLLSIPCDTPFAPRDLAERLLSAANVDSAPAAIAQSGGVKHPACAVWSVTLAGQLLQYLAAGRLSLIGFADYVGCATVDWPRTPFDPFFNINTPEDLMKAERIAVQYSIG